MCNNDHKSKLQAKDILALQNIKNFFSLIHTTDFDKRTPDKNISFLSSPIQRCGKAEITRINDLPEAIAFLHLSCLSSSKKELIFNFLNSVEISYNHRILINHLLKRHDMVYKTLPNVKDLF